MQQFKIKKITDHNGKSQSDNMHLSRVGRLGSFVSAPREGRCLLMDYEIPHSRTPGLMRTSKVQDVEQTKDGMMVRTQDSIYYLQEVG